MTVDQTEFLARIPIIPSHSWYDHQLHPATLTRLIMQRSEEKPAQLLLREQYRPGHWELASMVEYAGPFECGAHDVSEGGSWTGRLLNFIPLEKGRSGVIPLVDKRESTVHWDMAMASRAYLRRREDYFSADVVVQRFVEQFEKHERRHLQGVQEAAIMGLQVSAFHVSCQ